MLIGPRVRMGLCALLIGSLCAHMPLARGARPARKAAPTTSPPDEAAKAALEDSKRKTEARIHFKQGKAYQLEGAYLRAAEEYQKAYEVLPLPELLFNLGQVYRLAGNKVEARTYYEKFLSEQPEGVASDEARTHLAVITRQLDEEEVARAKAERERTAPPLLAPGRVGTPSEADLAAAASAGRGYKIAGLVAGAAGVGLVVWGVLNGLEAGSKSDDITAAQRMNPSVWPTTLDQTWQEGVDANNRMILLTAVGGGLAVTGGLLYYLGVRRNAAATAAASRATQVRPLFLGRGGGVRIEGSF